MRDHKKKKKEKEKEKFIEKYNYRDSLRNLKQELSSILSVLKRETTLLSVLTK